MKTLTRLASTSIAALAISATSIGAANATLTTPTYHSSVGLSQAQARTHLMGAAPTDAGLRNVTFSRSRGVLTVTAKVNRIDPYKVDTRSANNWQRDSKATFRLLTGTRQISGVYITAGRTTGTTGQSCFTNGIGMATNIAAGTYTFRVPLNHLAGCGIKHGQTLTIAVTSQLQVQSAGPQGTWTSNTSGPQFTFKY